MSVKIKSLPEETYDDLVSNGEHSCELRGILETVTQKYEYKYISTPNERNRQYISSIIERPFIKACPPTIGTRKSLSCVGVNREV